MLIFLLSLAGIPPLAGFFGKFYLFAAALGGKAPNLGLLWLVILAVAMSAVSLYYYLQVLKQIFVAAPSGESWRPAPASEASLMRWLVGLMAGGVVLLGCLPSLLLNLLQPALESAGF
jgi:NADH-quinone oxidoreductase subunit N